MSEHIRVLLVEDNPADARLLREAIREANGVVIHVTHEDRLAHALRRLEEQHFDVIMLDLSLPDAEGLDTLVRIHQRAPLIPIVVLTGLDDESLAVRAVREGAQDYLVKGQVDSQLLVRAMRYATERQRAVEALQQSEEYFRALIENALDIITVLDSDGTIRYGSPSVARVLGFVPAELAGVYVLSLVHPQDRQMVLERIRAGLIAPGSTQTFQTRVRHKNGTWRVLEAIGKRFDASSAVSGFVINSRDITERTHAEEALREANETVKAVIETSPLGIYSIDLAGNVKSWNRTAEQIFGFRSAETLDRPLPIVPPDEFEAFRERLRNPLFQNPVAGIEERRRRSDGSTVEVARWSAPLRDASGKVTGFVALLTDNTERKRLEEQFRQSQKMEAVGRLAGGVAHDFNNLLTVITGYSQMVSDRLETDDPRAEAVQQVLRASDRATALTKQLLAFSRQQVVQPKVLDVGMLVKDMAQMLKRLVGETIELMLIGVPARVYADPGQIEQVIVNLAVNARDAMPSGGRLGIETSVTEFDTFSMMIHPGLTPGPYVLLSISDTGCGMTAETKAHLFEPFFTTKERGRGTGLGLSTSYGIVKQNGGEILVYSEPDIGSAFKIYLPRVEEPLDVEPSSVSGSERFRGSETVLVVEDEDDVRRVVVHMLQQLGYDVLTAASGAEAMRLCGETERHIHLLLTDVVMPKMSGKELADRLCGNLPGLKVLFVSGYTGSVIIHHGVLDPGTHFLQKPFSAAQLGGKVREVLEG
jgi:two-component system, cell cycle sensor histidine kinase and response regulator CckA